MKPYVTDYAERLPLSETENRLYRFRAHLRRLMPEAAGALILSQLNLYYFCGTLGIGVLWIPLEGVPVLLIRKGLERARAESSLKNILPYHSYGELAGLCKEAGSPLPVEEGVIGADMIGITWAQSRLLCSHLPEVRFVPADAAVRLTRAVKTAWELDKMRAAGIRHEYCFCKELPRRIHEGMSEWNIARIMLEMFMEKGHCGIARVTPPGRVALGSVAAGESALYPTSFDGPLGVHGLHPAMPNLGDTRVIWRRGQLLTVDAAFCFEGYNTDKTVNYWLGSGPLPDIIQRAHACCIEMHSRAAEGLRPGTKPSALWELACGIAARDGFAGHFMGVGPERVRFLGHGIGLEVDEFPVAAVHFDDPLEEGMTLALEPKIGIPGVGMVGIENTFEVTPDGGRCLTGSDFSMIRVD